MLVETQNTAALLPGRRYFNLCGPTKTDVCTFYEVPSQKSEERTELFPIGQVCSHLRGAMAAGLR